MQSDRYFDRPNASGCAMNPLFPPELRTASLVKRWSIVRTLQSDSVAEHSFFVSFYALQIARLIGWDGPLADLQFYASMHDIEECVTGDILGPVKRGIVDPERFEDFAVDAMRVHLPLIGRQIRTILESPRGPDIKAIVKVADKVDAVIYLTIEIEMGNARLGPLLNDATANLTAAWDALMVQTGMGTGPSMWDNALWPAIQTHHKFGGIGLV